MSKQYEINNLVISESEAKKISEMYLKDNPVKKGRWKPQKNEKYYFTSDYYILNAVFYPKDRTDNFRLSQGNCFQTEAEAQEYLKYLTALGEVKSYIYDNDLQLDNVDWEDDSQYKYTLYYSHLLKKWTLTCWDNTQMMTLLPPLKSSQACQQLITAQKDNLDIIRLYKGR